MTEKISRAQSEPLPLTAIFGWTIFFGLTSALVQNLVRVARYYLVVKPLPPNYHDFFTLLPTETFWMVPISQLLLFAIVGGLLVAGSLLLRRRLRANWLTTIFVATMSVEVCFLIVGRKISLPALFVLALGLGVAGGRWVRRRPQWVRAP